MKSPKLAKLERDGTHRLILRRYSDHGKPILDRIAQDNASLLNDLIELEGATNNRLLGESGKLPGISAIELISGFRFAHIVNASFIYTSPTGGRFNSAERGAWYAAVELETAQTEVAFHMAVQLSEIPSWKKEEIVPYIDYLADFRHEFHDIQGDSDFAECLNPNSYSASQPLGLELLNSGSAGIVYPSVRHNGGVCVACFRPPLVQNVRQGPKVTFTFVDAKVTDCVIEN